MIVIERRLLVINGFWSVRCPDVFDRSPVLILRRAAPANVLFIRQSRRADVRRNITLVLRQRAAQALAIHQLRVKFACHQAGYRLAHVVLIRLIAEHPQIKGLLKLLCQRCPVGAHCLQPFKHHPLLVAFLNQSGVALLAALVGSANGRH